MTYIDSVLKIALCARAEERRVNPRHFKCDHPGCEKAYTTNQRLKNHKLAVHSGPYSSTYKNLSILNHYDSKLVSKINFVR